MCITIEDLLAHSFVLSTDKCRLDRFYTVFKRNGLVPLPCSFSGRMVERNSREYAVNRHYIAAHISHMQICAIADAMGWPFVCIFEDDAYPCRNIVRELSLVLSEIPDNARICRLGYVPYDGNEIESDCRDNWISILDKTLMSGYTAGSHAYVVFRVFFPENRRMLEKFSVSVQPLIDTRAMHNPKFLKQEEQSEIWFYEWLMAPTVFRHALQDGVYSVGLRNNLFTQYNFITWNNKTKSRFAPNLWWEMARKKCSIKKMLSDYLGFALRSVSNERDGKSSCFDV